MIIFAETEHRPKKMKKERQTPETAYQRMLQRIKQNVHEVEPEAEVWLYGSRARRDARADSDWDVLVLSSKASLTFREEEAFMDDGDEWQEDPRERLEFQLRLYEIFKQQSLQLRSLETTNRFTREPVYTDEDAKIVIKSFNLDSLIDAYGKILFKRLIGWSGWTVTVQKLSEPGRAQSKCDRSDLR